MPNALVFRPDYEVLTRYTSKYLEAYVVRSAAELGFSVTDLYAEEAVSNRFFQEIDRQDLVVFGTHGLEDRLYAQNGTILFSSCSGDECLSGKICFALACRSASKLGFSAVDKGCRCYFGWLQDFVVIIDESYTDPLDDPYAGSFLRPVVNGINAMLLSYIYGRRLNEIAERLRERGMAVKVIVAEARDVADAIVEEAEEGKYDLILMFKRKRKGLKHVLTRSISERVAKATKRPVMTILKE